MTASPSSYLLISHLPLHFAPAHRYFDLYTLVPSLVDSHPDWTIEDCREFLEEKTRRSLHPEDYTTLRTLHTRCIRLREEFEE